MATLYSSAYLNRSSFAPVYTRPRFGYEAMPKNLTEEFSVATTLLPEKSYDLRHISISEINEMHRSGLFKDVRAFSQVPLLPAEALNQQNNEEATFDLIDIGQRYLGFLEDQGLPTEAFQSDMAVFYNIQKMYGHLHVDVLV